MESQRIGIGAALLMGAAMSATAMEGLGLASRGAAQNYREFVAAMPPEPPHVLKARAKQKAQKAARKMQRRHKANRR